MHTVLDCRGLACPQPVIRAKELLDSVAQGSVEVLVDNEAAQSNLARFGKSQGCAVTIRASGDTRHITLSKDTSAKDAGAVPTAEEYRCDLPATSLVMVIPAETMGRGDDALGRVLMRAYVKTIKNLNPLPEKIFFYNGGVKITATESDLIAPLHPKAFRPRADDLPLEERIFLRKGAHGDHPRHPLRQPRALLILEL